MVCGDVLADTHPLYGGLRYCDRHADSPQNDSMHDTPEQIETAIAALDAQRKLLGDAITEMAIAPLREKLAAARARARSGDQQLKPVTILFMDVVGSTDRKSVV